MSDVGDSILEIQRHVAFLVPADTGLRFLVHQGRDGYWRWELADLETTPEGSSERVLGVSAIQGRITRADVEDDLMRLADRLGLALEAPSP